MNIKPLALKKDNIREGNVEFIEIATSNNSLSNLPHKNLINRLHAIILCTDNPEETIARYCWLTNQSSPKRIFDESWQIQLGQQSIVVCAQKESNRLALDVGSFNTPSILGYALLTNNLTKTNDFFSDNQTLKKSLKGDLFLQNFQILSAETNNCREYSALPMERRFGLKFARLNI